MAKLNTWSTNTWKESWECIIFKQYSMNTMCEWSEPKGGEVQSTEIYTDTQIPSTIISQKLGSQTTVLENCQFYQVWLYPSSMTPPSHQEKLPFGMTPALEKLAILKSPEDIIKA